MFAAVLRYGVIGLSFLLAYLAYGLLQAEARREEPRASMTSLVKAFMAFSVVLSVVGLTAQLAPLVLSAESTRAVTQSAILRERDVLRDSVGDLVKANASLEDVRARHEKTCQRLGGTTMITNQKLREVLSEWC